jgi:hypothetical protein
MDATTAEAVKSVATDAIKILGPALITAWVSYRIARSQLALEKVRAHGKDRIEANRKLFLFAQRLLNRTFPLASNKKTAFLAIMDKEYFGALEKDLLYLDDKSLELLELLESQYVCMTDGDLVPEMDATEERAFIEETLYKHANLLRERARAATRSVADA